MFTGGVLLVTSCSIINNENVDKIFASKVFNADLLDKHISS